MGVFYVEDDDSIEAKKKKEKLINDYANECREKTSKIPNSKFPEYIWKVEINEFENADYKMMGMCDDPEVHKVYRLGSKYNDINMYFEALNIYQNYMYYLEERCGSREMLDCIANSRINTGTYIPREPRLTHKKKFKTYFNFGIIPSRILPENELDRESMLEILSNIKGSEYAPIDQIDIPEWYDRIIDEVNDKMAKRNRIANIHSKGHINVDSGDAIIEFLLSGSSSRVINDESREISDFLDEIRRHDLIPKDILDSMFKVSPHFIVDGKRVQENDVDEIFKQMIRNGFSVGSDGLGASKGAIRAVKSQFGFEPEVMTEKELKKLKKKQLKDKKRRIREQASDRKTQEILLNNRVDFVGSDEYSLNHLLDSLR